MSDGNREIEPLTVYAVRVSLGWRLVWGAGLISADRYASFEDAEAAYRSHEVHWV